MKENSSILNSIKFRLGYRIVCFVLIFTGIVSNIIWHINDKYPEEFVYYTLQSNIICAVVMLMLIINNIKALRKGEKWGRQEKYIVLEFGVSIWILITCLVYNILLGSPFELEYWTKSLHNPILHLFGPVMFILDFFLFAKHGKIKNWSPMLSVVYPYFYIVYIVIRGIILGNIYNGNIPEEFVVYPYFFLDVNELGYRGMLWWVAKLTVAFVAIGFIFLGIDKLLARKTKTVG